MSDQPTNLPAVELAPAATSDPAPVVFPSDGTPYAAPAPVDPAVDGVVPADVAPVVPVTEVQAAVDAAVTAGGIFGREVVAPAGGQLVELPSGYKVALRSTRSVRARDRKSLFVGVDFESKDAMSVGLVVLANVQKLLIVDWDVKDYDNATGEPVGDVLALPSQTEEDVLGGLSLEDANKLDEVTQEAQKVLLPNFAPDPSPESPTQPSAG